MKILTIFNENGNIILYEESNDIPPYPLQYKKIEYNNEGEKHNYSIITNYNLNSYIVETIFYNNGDEIDKDIKIINRNENNINSNLLEYDDESDSGNDSDNDSGNDSGNDNGNDSDDNHLLKNDDDDLDNYMKRLKINNNFEEIEDLDWYLYVILTNIVFIISIKWY